jgi:hypothetical protein
MHGIEHILLGYDHLRAQNNDVGVELALHMDRVTILAFGHRASPSATQSSRRPLLHRNHLNQVQAQPDRYQIESPSRVPQRRGLADAYRILTR